MLEFAIIYCFLTSVALDVENQFMSLFSAM